MTYWYLILFAWQVSYLAHMVTVIHCHWEVERVRDTSDIKVKKSSDKDLTQGGRKLHRLEGRKFTSVNCVHVYVTSLWEAASAPCPPLEVAITTVKVKRRPLELSSLSSLSLSLSCTLAVFIEPDTFFATHRALVDIAREEMIQSSKGELSVRVQVEEVLRSIEFSCEKGRKAVRFPQLRALLALVHHITHSLCVCRLKGEICHSMSRIAFHSIHLWMDTKEMRREERRRMRKRERRKNCLIWDESSLTYWSVSSWVSSSSTFLLTSLFYLPLSSASSAIHQKPSPGQPLKAFHFYNSQLCHTLCVTSTVSWLSNEFSSQLNVSSSSFILNLRLSIFQWNCVFFTSERTRKKHRQVIHVFTRTFLLSNDKFTSQNSHWTQTHECQMSRRNDSVDFYFLMLYQFTPG